MDMTAYNELKDIMGDVLHDLINTFLDNMPDQITSLQLALQEDNCEQVFAIAHRIKSSSSSIGATGLAAYAEALEMKGRAGDVSDSDEQYASLVEQYEKVEAFLRSELP